MLDINKRIQNIGDINNSENILVINGDLTIDGVHFTKIQTTLFEILRSDFEKYSYSAIEQAKLEVNNFIKDILENLHLSHKLYLLDNFQKLSIQSSLRDALKGYVFTENPSTKFTLIQSLIARIEVNPSSTEACIIEEALATIPNLNTTAFSLLAIMALRHFKVFPEFSIMLEMYFSSLSPIVDNFISVTNLDIEYLIAKGCAKELKNFQRIERLENIFIYQYDLFFRHKGCWKKLQEYHLLHPEIMHCVNDKGTCMFMVDEKNNQWSFIEVSSNEMYNRLLLRKQDYLIPLVEELKKQTPSFNISDMQKYFRKINKNWDTIFLLMSGQTLTNTVLNPVGLFIGTQYLSKYTGGTPLTISSFKL